METRSRQVYQGNPAFQDLMSYVPQQVHTDAEGKNRIFDEMWTADWWWDTQVL